MPDLHAKILAAIDEAIKNLYSDEYGANSDILEDLKSQVTEMFHEKEESS